MFLPIFTAPGRYTPVQIFAPRYGPFADRFAQCYENLFCPVPVIDGSETDPRAEPSRAGNSSSLFATRSTAPGRIVDGGALGAL